MNSNVDYTICPECSALNAAMWNMNGLQSYDVSCTICGHEYERGRFASDGIRLLVHEEPKLDDDGLLALSPEQIEKILRIDAAFDEAEQFFSGGYGDYWEEI